MNPTDPVLDEIERIRDVRRGICDALANDPQRLLEHYRDVERELLGAEFYGMPVLTPGMFLERERRAGRLPRKR